MCGITGWIDWKRDLSNERPVLQKMADAIRHRGPDAEGFWLSPRAALAHRRLIVIDPVGGAQPMLYRTGENTVALTYNGEIYNFRELREELETLGHTFQTKSDTEVLLHAYLEWGEDCIRRLNGIFAFAIWDERTQKLFLGRDHLGVKPLFYAQRDGMVLFASELKALLAHPEIRPEVDADGLAEIFALGPMRTPGVGVFRGIKEVRAGHAVSITEEQTRVTQYWQLKSKPFTDDVETAIDYIRHLLEDTVKRQLISDMPVVSMLSGGLDSSGLTAIAAKEFRESGKTLHTYSIDFVGSDQHFQKDLLHVSLDAPYVQMVSDFVHSRHHSIVLSHLDLIDHLSIPTRARDLPGIGEMEASLYLLFREMKKEATVSLSGESADEVFSGYPWFHQEAFLNSGTFPWNQSIAFFAEVLNEDAKAKIKPQEYRQARYEEALNEFDRLDGESEIAAKQREMSYLFITRFLPFMLDRKDRMSMYTGFEVRVPFCDYRLVEYLWNMPWQVKSIGEIEKGILRRALKGYLPEEVRWRKKSAYPTAQDPTYYRSVREWMKEVLNDPNAPILPLINKQLVDDIVEHKFSEAPFEVGKMMEYLVQVNFWLQEYRITLV
ncbi:asparagine synthase (glutamine-hydrolyzing) [Thermoactinomyces sp. CICC 10522]|uniref:asparagine synthase (glutamine-hydrolyzing) n=1 Tax=Thermoactinomyces sp. CICC 10522 TaxID=2767427 RepID=UPI0018DC44BD|nr:asparagine synthase (glutamine-hydrolyzing) [Thermoactinomyces sp. CICC 10522]MBH8605145.1 asparagine synthase (glutamine-hydrolyzing) [Thermoactinomyces sp. CICC 10522]